MNTIKRTDLIEKFYNQVGNTFVTASVETTVKLKGGNPFGEVKKAQKLNGCVGFDYLGSVNRKEEKYGTEITEEAKPRQWGTLNKNRTVVEHTLKTGEEKRYLQIGVQSTPDAEESYYFNPETGEKYDAEEINKWKYASKKSSTQANLPEDVEVIVRDIDFKNIKEIKMGGEHYIVVD